MPKSTRTKAAGKSVAKPYPEFPLTVHAGAGQWSKKLKQPGVAYTRTFYFGPLADWKAAYARYEREWPYLIRGETPPPVEVGDGLTIRDLCNSFITSKQNRLASGELTAHSIAAYHRACESLIGYFGPSRFVADLRPDDFEGFRAHLAKGCRPATVLSKINRVRVVLKHAYDSELIDRPVRYGKSFDRPGVVTLRKARKESPPRMLEADELRRIIEAAGTPMRAMILLGLNCGFGNTDCSSLPQSAVNLETGWVEFPRPKTGVRRRCALWPETVAAIRAAIERRPPHRDPADAGLCFLTSRRTRFVRVKADRKSGKLQTINTVARHFEALLARLGIERGRAVSFYVLRHVFETIGGGCRDQVAVDAIMGHVDASMAGQYRERFEDDRLQAVSNHVREWLWPEGAESGKSPKSRDAN